MNILVSRCLLGEPCRYDGKSEGNEGVMALREQGHRLIPVCPEEEGGLPTPRPPAEIGPEGRVINREGRDVTAEYTRGAYIALERARDEGCTVAVLKQNSPSCGCRGIYDGTFSKCLIPGQGVTARLLTRCGIRVVGEDELSLLDLE